MNVSIPRVGSTVRVVTKYKNSFILSNDEFKYNTYTGTVVSPEKWMKPGDFAVATGNPKYPISIIASKNVHEIEIIQGKVDTISVGSERVFRVRSKTKNTEYLVTANGLQVRCNCTGFGFRKTCKHATAVAQKLRGS